MTRFFARRPTVVAKPETPLRLRVAIGLWAAAGAAALIWAAAAPAGFHHEGRFPAVLTIAVSASLVLFAEARKILLPHRSEDVVRSGWGAADSTAAILLVAGGTNALIGIGLGLTVHQILAQKPPARLLFNVGHQTATAAAGLVVMSMVMPGTLDLNYRSVLAALLGVAVYEFGSLCAVTHTISLSTERPWRSVLRTAGRLSLVSSAGNMAIGALAGLLWHVEMLAVALVIIPILIVRNAFRQVVESTESILELRDDRDRLIQTVAGVTDGVVLVDSDYAIQVFSPAAIQLAGEGEEAVGQPADRLLRFDLDGQRTSARDLIERTNAADPVWSDNAVLCVGRRELPVAVTVTGRFDPDGRYLGAVIVLHDRTAELQAARMKDEFLARVSHDLRTPLTPIMTFGELLRSDRRLLEEAEVDESLDVIVSRANHMVRLVDDLLLVARISSGDLRVAEQLRITDVDPLAVAREVALDVGLGFPDHTITVAAAAHDLPSLHTDPARLAQVLSNLVSNGCKYSDASSVVISLRADGSDLAIDVTDRGIGIAPAELDAVFERFHRSPGAPAAAGGAGVGLYVVRTLVEALGGHVHATSNVGEGSTLSVSLPLAGPDRAGPRRADRQEGHGRAGRTNGTTPASMDRAVESLVGELASR